MLFFLQFSLGTTAVVTSSRHRPFCFHNFVFLLHCLFVLYIRNMQRATRISGCIIAVRKSHEFLLKVHRLSLFFSTTTRIRLHVDASYFFSTTTQVIRLRRRVDVFFNDVGHCCLRLRNDLHCVGWALNSTHSACHCASEFQTSTFSPINV